MAKSKKHSSALSEKQGVPSPETSNKAVAKKIQERRRHTPEVNELFEDLLQGNAAALSRAITMVESTALKHQEAAKKLIQLCLPHANQSVRIGITGVPGVGKSTFIEQFGTLLTGRGKKVAVLAVDPTSTLSRGSILGDKTRMEELVKDPNAFIRPSASGESLGGVARKTRETMILCEAAGFDTLLIETVGVGQSETAVHSMTDFFLLLKLAGAGDELQGIKRGIMEMADAIVINKTDGSNIKAAQLAKTEFNRALHLYPEKESGWSPKTLTCSALTNEGIEEVWKLMEDYWNLVSDNGYLQQKRNDQNRYWLLQTIDEQLKRTFYHHPKIKEELAKQLQLIQENKTTPFEAADLLISLQK